jgi:4a-hydroxytetrahydrobiopterin dehydratase
MSKRVYTEAEIAPRLSQDLPHWHWRNGSISRTYRTGNWKGTLMLVTTIGHLAEAAWHHPELAVSYNSVRVDLHSHDAKGVTDRDFELARKIEEVVMWQPGKQGGALEGTPQSDHAIYVKYDA